MDDSDKKIRDNIKISGGAGAGKEEEPGMDRRTEDEGQRTEVSKSVEKEKRKEAGEYIKEIPIRPEIPPEVERAGVKHATPTGPVVKKPKKKIQLPLTDEQIVVGLHAHVWQSIRWLATWCVRKLKKAHVAIREVKGKLVRS